MKHADRMKETMEALSLIQGISLDYTGQPVGFLPAISYQMWAFVLVTLGVCRKHVFKKPGRERPNRFVDESVPWDSCEVPSPFEAWGFAKIAVQLRQDILDGGFEEMVHEQS